MTDKDIQNYQKKIEAMLRIQDRLNTKTNGEAWYDGMTKEGREINWRRCMFLESAEALDSFNWKHWKDIGGKTDYDNIKIEVTDIWHFVMSELISSVGINMVQSEEVRKNTFRRLAEDIVQGTMNFKEMANKVYETGTLPSAEMKRIEKFAKVVLSEETTRPMDIVESFFDMGMAFLDVDELFKLYLGKSVLNQFRQDNGYKDGTYIKIWNGEEDNVVMQRIINKKGLSDFDEIIAALSEEYDKVKTTASIQSDLEKSNSDTIQPQSPKGV